MYARHAMIALIITRPLRSFYAGSSYTRTRFFTFFAFRRYFFSDASDFFPNIKDLWKK